MARRIKSKLLRQLTQKQKSKRFKMATKSTIMSALNKTSKRFLVSLSMWLLGKVSKSIKITALARIERAPKKSSKKRKAKSRNTRRKAKRRSRRAKTKRSKASIRAQRLRNLKKARAAKKRKSR